MLLAGGLLGYSVRAVIFIIRKNNLEFSISEKIMQARKAAQKIVDDAYTKAETALDELRETERLKEIDFKTTEDRFMKKEALIDARQA